MPFSHLRNGDGVLLYCTMDYGVVISFHQTIDKGRTFEVYECGINNYSIISISKYSVHQNI